MCHRRSLHSGSSIRRNEQSALVKKMSSRVSAFCGDSSRTINSGVSRLVNVFMALTMLPFGYACLLAYERELYQMAFWIALSGVPSAMYHFHESQKHNLFLRTRSPPPPSTSSDECR